MTAEIVPLSRRGRYFGNHNMAMGISAMVTTYPVTLSSHYFRPYAPSEPWHVYPINMLGGAIWAGYGIGSFNFLLSVSPAEQRARYTAIYQIAVADSAALGAALGGLISSYMVLTILFVISGIRRFAAAGIFARYVHPPEEEQVILQGPG